MGFGAAGTAAVGTAWAWWRGLPRWERRLLFVALAGGLAIRLVAVLATLDHRLASDEPYYHQAAMLQADGQWFWSNAPYGVPHESLQKAPIYQTWVGLWYLVAGIDADKVRL